MTTKEQEQYFSPDDAPERVKQELNEWLDEREYNYGK